MEMVAILTGYVLPFSELGLGAPIVGWKSSGKHS